MGLEVLSLALLSCTVSSTSARLSMKQTFNLIRHDCGEVCDTTIEAIGKGKVYDTVEKDTDCDALFQSEFIEGFKWQRGPLEVPLPPKLHELNSTGAEYFSYQGRVKILNSYMDDSEATGRRFKVDN